MVDPLVSLVCQSLGNLWKITKKNAICQTTGINIWIWFYVYFNGSVGDIYLLGTNLTGIGYIYQFKCAQNRIWMLLFAVFQIARLRDNSWNETSCLVSLASYWYNILLSNKKTIV